MKHFLFVLVFNNCFNFIQCFSVNVPFINSIYLFCLFIHLFIYLIPHIFNAKNKGTSLTPYIGHFLTK